MNQLTDSARSVQFMTFVMVGGLFMMEFGVAKSAVGDFTIAGMSAAFLIMFGPTIEVFGEKIGLRLLGGDDGD